jgi:hypothetical protein
VNSVKDDVYLVLRIMQLFVDAAGLRINLGKSYSGEARAN